MVIGSFFLSFFIIGCILSAWQAEKTPGENSAIVEFFINHNVVITILVITTTLSGLGQAVVWVGAGEYMSLCATEESKGFYFGFFWVFYMSSQIFGNFLGAISIENASGPFFYIMLGCVFLVAVPAYGFLKVP